MLKLEQQWIDQILSNIKKYSSIFSNSSHAYVKKTNEFSAERILRRGFERRDDFKQFVLENLTRVGYILANIKGFIIKI